MELKIQTSLHFSSSFLLEFEFEATADMQVGSGLPVLAKISTYIWNKNNWLGYTGR